MAKYFTSFILLLFVLGKFSSAETFTVKNSGTTFSPANVTIKAGDKVKFELGASHNAVEVSKTVYDANGNTSNGGFSVPFGGGEITLSTPGTYYYVCTPHAGLGMKGSIVVTSVTGIPETASLDENILKVYPNPAVKSFSVDFRVNLGSAVTLDLIDITGKGVKNLVSSSFTPGEYKKVFPVDGMVPGLYFVRYTSEDQRIAIPLIISH